MTNRKQIIAAVALVAAFGISSCTKNKNTPVSEGNKNQVLHLGNGTEPQDLDPHIVTGVPEDNLIRSMFEGLVSEDPIDLHPVPGMAESWTLSPDKKTYTFKIRKNAKWSNGDPFTAHDFVYSWKRALSPALGGEYAYMLFAVKNAENFNKGYVCKKMGKNKEGAEECVTKEPFTDFAQVGAKATDDYTFVVTLDNPTPFFLSLLNHYSSYPVHKATVEKFGKMDERGTPWTRPGNIVSNGPFVLKTWELNKVIAVTRNPNYWDAATVKLNEIHFHPVDSQQTEEKMFRAGELHITNEVPLNKIAVYQKDSPEFLRIDPYLGTYFYRVNVTKKPLNDKRIRHALSLALDRQTLVDKVTKGGQIPAWNFTPPGTAGFTAESKTEYNVEKAKQLLAEAGFPGGKGLAPIEILYNTSEAHKVIAEAIQQMWKTALGVDVTLSNQDWKVYLNSQKTLNYQVSRAGWIGDYSDPNTFIDMWVTGGGNNQTGFSSKEYDNLLKESQRAPTQEARFAIFQKMEKILSDEMPIIPIYTYTRVHLVRPEVKSWTPTILDHHPYKHVSLDAGATAQNLTKN